MDYSALTPISFLLRLLETSAEFFILLILLNKKVKPISFILYVVIFSSLLIFLRGLSSFFLWPFLTIFLAILFLVILLKVNWIRISIMYILTMTIVGLIDFLCSSLLLLIFDLPSFESIVDNKHIYYLGMFMVSSIIYLIAIILFTVKKPKFYSFCEKFKNTAILSNSLITLILLFPNIFILITYFDRKPLPLWIIFVNIFSIILMFLVSIYNIHNLLRLICSEEELIYQKNYNSTLENLLDGLRTFKHDYNNTLQTLYGYTQLGNLTALKKIFEQILDESKAINSLDKLNPNLINNPSIFGLITAKYHLCKKNNIIINFEIFGNLENLDIQIFDLTRMLGIFLDNAIEAASGSRDKKANFLISETKNTVTIEISNTYSDKSISPSTIFEKGVSSKGRNRGLGLFEVSKILKKYPNISLTTIADGNKFLQKLTIPKLKHI